MTRQRPWKKSEKRAMVFAILAAACLIGVTFVKSDLDADPVITFPKPAVRPVPNGFDIYLAASKAIVRTLPACDEVLEYDPKHGYPLAPAQRYSLARKATWLKLNATAFALVDKALRTPCRHPEELDMDMTFPMGRIAYVAQAKVVECHLWQLKHHPGRFMDCALDIIQMANDTASGGNFFAKSRDTAMEEKACDALDDYPESINQLNEAESVNAILRLKKIMARRATFAAANEASRWSALYIFQKCSHMSGWRGGFDSFSGDKRRALSAVLANHLIAKRSIVQEINETFDANAKALSAPYRPEMWALNSLSDPDRIINDYNLQTGNFERAMQCRDNVRTSRLLIRLALQAHKMKFGVYPNRLDRLSPAFLAHVPLDDFSGGQPFHYKSTGKDYVLWSVGPDGVDDGGKPAPRTHGHLRKDSPTWGELKGDFVDTSASKYP